MNLELSDVGETALIPLAVRANESKRKNARIYDLKAVEIIDNLKLDIKKYDKLITHECVVARTILFDEVLRQYIIKYPDAICINLGCGLDNRFERVDNLKIQWYSVDLPSSIALRKKVFSNSQREHMLEVDILNRDWSLNIPKNKPIIIIAEGLFMYFSKEELTKILTNITYEFKTGILLAEIMHQNMMKEDMHETVKYTKAKFGWGIKSSAKELTELNEKLEFVDKISFSEKMKTSSFISKLLGLIIGNRNNMLAIYKW